MRNYLTIATVCVAALGLGGAALAAEDAATSMNKSADSMSHEAKSAAELAPLADRLVGKNITNASGEDIGEIEDLAIGPDQNTYAVVSVGQFLGLGGKEVPIQIDELNMEGEEIVLISQSTKEALEARPEYDPAMYKSYSDHKDAAGETEY